MRSTSSQNKKSSSIFVDYKTNGPQHPNKPKILRFLSLIFLPLFCLFFIIFSTGANRNDTDGTAIASINKRTAINKVSADENHNSTTHSHEGIPDQPISDRHTDLTPSSNQAQLTVLEGKIKEGDSFDLSLRRLDLSPKLRQLIIQKYSKCLDFKRLRPKDRYTVTLDKDGTLISSQYEVTPMEIYSIKKAVDGYTASRVPVTLECRTVRLEGTINYSLFSSFLEKGEDPSLIYTFADIFSSKIDFNTESREGDRFSVVFEKYYKEGAFAKYGKILIARYEQEDKPVLEGYYFAPADKRGAYFDEQGRELGSSFIRSPVPFGRLSSKFSYHRKHPILGIVRPHLGVDLAAPVGTPIMAAADGKVISAGVRGANGKQVILQHRGGYKTYYGHLSRYKKGLKKGSVVKQKEIIGYVGSTGLSTGPHLDYRIKHGDTFKNPFSIEFKPKSVLSKAQVAELQEEIRLYADLEKIISGQNTLRVVNITIPADERISSL